jgi:hypothetical protein
MPAASAERHWHIQLLPKPGRRKIDHGHVAQNTLAQRDMLQIAHIPAQGHLGIGPAIDIVEQKTRQPTARQFAIIQDRCRFHPCLSHFTNRRAVTWPFIRTLSEALGESE